MRQSKETQVKSLAYGRVILAVRLEEGTVKVGCKSSKKSIKGYLWVWECPTATAEKWYNLVMCIETKHYNTMVEDQIK